MKRADDTFVTYDMYGNPVLVRRSAFDRLPAWLKLSVFLGLLAISFAVTAPLLRLAVSLCVRVP